MKSTCLPCWPPLRTCQRPLTGLLHHHQEKRAATLTALSSLLQLPIHGGFHPMREADIAAKPALGCFSLDGLNEQQISMQKGPELPDQGEIIHVGPRDILRMLNDLPD